MAIKYAGLRGKEVRVIGKNRSTLGEEETIQQVPSKSTCQLWLNWSNGFRTAIVGTWRGRFTVAFIKWDYDLLRCRAWGSALS
jgi:hypothetical protein